ncbi:unnamed protein product [Euphydryas editha]|uniref:DUF4817 domain-containing protein n=1 Tax=Euphydryas editha TaxID=104508 RepID=A0AAU9U9V7_EUPED|nr:unnamed protein product [Euphydryas editha]
MTTFTNEEYADFFICYGYCNCVSLRAREEYIARYPGRRVPDISVSDGVYRRLRETGSVSRRRTDLGRPRINEDDEEQDNEIIHFDWIGRGFSTTGAPRTTEGVSESEWTLIIPIGGSGEVDLHRGQLGVQTLTPMCGRT